jgi:hypothetical protein
MSQPPSNRDTPEAVPHHVPPEYVSAPQPPPRPAHQARPEGYPVLPPIQVVSRTPPVGPDDFVVPSWVLYGFLLLFMLGAGVGILGSAVGVNLRAPTYIHVEMPCNFRVDPTCPGPGGVIIPVTPARQLPLR